MTEKQINLLKDCSKMIYDSLTKISYCKSQNTNKYYEQICEDCAKTVKILLDLKDDIQLNYATNFPKSLNSLIAYDTKVVAINQNTLFNKTNIGLLVNSVFHEFRHSYQNENSNILSDTNFSKKYKYAIVGYKTLIECIPDKTFNIRKNAFYKTCLSEKDARDFAIKCCRVIDNELEKLSHTTSNSNLKKIIKNFISSQSHSTNFEEKTFEKHYKSIESKSSNFADRIKKFIKKEFKVIRKFQNAKSLIDRESAPNDIRGECIMISTACEVFMDQEIKDMLNEFALKYECPEVAKVVIDNPKFTTDEDINHYFDIYYEIKDNINIDTKYINYRKKHVEELKNKWLEIYNQEQSIVTEIYNKHKKEQEEKDRVTKEKQEAEEKAEQAKLLKQKEIEKRAEKQKKIEEIQSQVSEFLNKRFC